MLSNAVVVAVRKRQHMVRESVNDDGPNRRFRPTDHRRPRGLVATYLKFKTHFVLPK